jgi:hypothetical protein
MVRKLYRRGHFTGQVDFFRTCPIFLSAETRAQTVYAKQGICAVSYMDSQYCVRPLYIQSLSLPAKPRPETGLPGIPVGITCGSKLNR